MPHLTHDDPEKVYACPHCDAADIQHRCPDHPQAGGETEFYCRDCGRDIREPRVRKKYNKTSSGRGARSKLEQMLDENPDLQAEHGTVGFEPASKLRTDGGNEP